MNPDLQQCYRLLDLEPGAHQADVKRAYRELVRVWHPDRFTHDPVLQRKAQEKLKQINLAYERIREHEGDQSRTRGVSPQSSSSHPREAHKTTGEDATRGSSGTKNEQDPKQPKAPAQSQEATSKRRFVTFAAIVLVVIAIMLIAPTQNTPTIRRGDSTPTYVLPSATTVPTKIVTEDFHRGTPEFHRSSPASPLAAHSQNVKSDVPTPDPNEAKQPTSASDHFTLGSTTNEVLTIQGTPDHFNEAQYGYGYSTVYFVKGKVSGWSNISHNLKAQLLPTSSTPSQSNFTIGSSKDEVLTLQGTPDRVTLDQFQYAYSTVYFLNGRVNSWSNISKNLKVQLLPLSKVESVGYFTVGSTSDEVLTLQGTPDRVTRDQFQYSYSTVYFANGRVKSWSNISHNLKAQLLTTPAAR